MITDEDNTVVVEKREEGSKSFIKNHDFKVLYVHYMSHMRMLCTYLTPTYSLMLVMDIRCVIWDDLCYHGNDKNLAKFMFYIDFFSLKLVLMPNPDQLLMPARISSTIDKAIEQSGLNVH